MGARELVKFLAARQHVDNQFNTLDLRLRPLCCLQPVGNRIQICFVECRVELLCFGVARELFVELGRHLYVTDGTPEFFL